MDEQPLSFRRSMFWLHTWAGVVLGSVMFAIFWMGTLSVFDREIDRWMMPATRRPTAPGKISLDHTARSAIAQLAPQAAQWSVRMPEPRVPTMLVRYPDPVTKQRVIRHVDPTNGEVAPDQGTLGGTGFIYPFHIMLHIEWKQLGVWLVGLAGLSMLALFVSGVIIHRRLFQDFFLFRFRAAPIRSSLDLHNVTGVLALPFHFVMCLSGLIIFFSIYYPSSWQAVYKDKRSFEREVFGTFERPKLGVPAQLGSLDAMASAAEREWGGAELAFMSVQNATDAAGVVRMQHASPDSVSLTSDLLYFDAVSGEVLQRSASRPIARIQRFVSGMHRVQFENWTLRWLYFISGLTGCVMIGSGFLYWLAARRVRHARDEREPLGVRVVEALTQGSVSGIIVATLAFFVGNRLLPLGAHAGGLGRAQLEMCIFYGCWALTFAHAALRPRRAWAEHCCAIALFAVTAPLLNWLTTGDHPLRAIARGSIAVAGMDALLLLAAGVAWVSFRRLRARDPQRAHAASPGRFEAGAHG